MGAPIVLNPPQVVVNQPPPPIVFGKDPFAIKDNAAKDKGFVPPAQEKPKEYTYKVSSGELKLGNELIGKGYSGKATGKNNSTMEKTKNLGPIPTGDYMIIGRITDPKNGEVWFKTNPMVNTSGRWPLEEFHIYFETNPPGNNPASYVVMPRDVRDRIEYRENPNNRLKVVP
jgi:hypothetical protein